MTDNNIPNELKYTHTHEWALLDDDGAVTIGITDHAQQQLGEMVFVELPELGENIAAGDEVGVVESVKAASDYYAPVGGEIIAVNEQLNDSPGLINTSPYADGWLCKIKPSNTSELDTLMDAESYTHEISEEDEN